MNIVYVLKSVNKPFIAAIECSTSNVMFARDRVIIR